MKKFFTIVAIVFCMSKVGYAQVSTGNAMGTAQQTIQLSLTTALDISFTNSNSANGSMVSMSFNDANDYANGVESGEQELRVRSNKNFKVGAKIDLSNFTYVGPGNVNPSQSPSNAVQLKVTSNNTGGSIVAGFVGYGSLNTTDKDIILNGVNGNDQKFKVKYKCNPGWAMPAGTYTFAIVYTATQQ